jgi:hypothetical protein
MNQATRREPLFEHVDRRAPDLLKADDIRTPFANRRELLVRAPDSATGVP